MNIIENIELKRNEILPELYEWVETFDWEFDEDNELTMKSYNDVFSLVQKFENSQCDENDYINILFHIKQINYNEIKINL
jgi:hypothetical protein